MEDLFSLLPAPSFNFIPGLIIFFVITIIMVGVFLYISYLIKIKTVRIGTLQALKEWDKEKIDKNVEEKKIVP